MNFNLFFDYAAIIIFVFLILSVILKKQIRGSGNKLFIATVVVALTTAVLDILASLSFFSLKALFVLNTLFMLSRASTAVALFFYATNLAKIYFRIQHKAWIILCLLIPYFIYAVSLIVNFFTPIIFDYLEGPTYVRGPWIPLAYSISYLYVAGGLVLIFLSRKYHMKSQVIAVFGAFLLQIGSSVFQFFVTDILVEMFICAITLSTLSLFIEGPENYIDFKTMNPNFHSFTTDVDQKFVLRQTFSAIFIHITNTSGIYNLYSSKESIEFSRACSAALLEKSRKVDRTSNVYFLGDATFVYVYDDRSKDDEMLRLINDYFSRPLFQHGLSYQFVVKTCLANCPEDCKDIESLVGFSTTYYEVTNTSCLDVKPFRRDAGNVLFELDHVLENAIQDKTFSLYYQGIYSLSEHRFTSAEALLRLNDPSFGVIMPGLMIPYAEKTGKIIEIGAIVLEKSFAFFAEKLRGKLEYLEVNLSPLQMLDPNLVPNIRMLAERYGIGTSEIIFEITESTAVLDSPIILNNIHTLRDLGYRIAIDDFGTGYSNISLLAQLDIQVLKYDKSMTDLLVTDEQDDFFLSLFRLFRKRDVKILFEGVETKEIADKLKKMGADYIQGYYYSKPIPEDEFLQLLTEDPKK